MKTKINIILGLSVIIIIATSCKREITNPYDTDCPKDIWTPRNFAAIQVPNKNSIELSWNQDILHIDGFKIDRKVGSSDWANIVSSSQFALLVSVFSFYLMRAIKSPKLNNAVLIVG